MAKKNTGKTPTLKPNKIGRPLKFKTVKELQDKIDLYFKDTVKEEWTITGLCMYLDTYRDVIIDYGNGKYDKEDKEYSNTIKKAKLKVENGYEIDLKKRGQSGTIFALKNFGWVDKTEIDQKTLNYNKDVSTLTDEELEKLINE